MGPARRPRATTTAAAPASAPSSTAAIGSGVEEALLARIASRSKVSGLRDQVRAYLEADCKENEGHARAKQLIPFVSRLLKQCGQELGTGPSDGIKAFADEFFGTMGVALDCLGRLRSWLAGSPIDVEIQRYGFVRRLMAWKIYDKAAEECRKIMLGLNAYISSAGCSKVPSKSQKSKRVMEVPAELILPPGNIKDIPPGLPALVVGLTGDFILCTIESGVRHEEVLRRLATVPLQLDPWLRTMGPSDAEKHREMFFKTLYRASSVLLSDPNVGEVDVLMLFCKMTLEWCIRAGQIDQYLKVARKLCSCSNTSRLQSDLCAAVLSDLGNISKLQAFWRSYELLEFVECYSKVCQSSGYGCNLFEHFSQFVEKAKTDVHPVTVLCGLYAVSLRLSVDSANNRSMDEKLIEGATEAVRWSFRLTASETWVWTTEARLGAFKALDYARKNFVNYVQVKWDLFLSSSSQLQYSPADSWALQLLHLFCEAVHAASRDRDQQDLVARGFRGAPTAAVAALRLSLILGIELEKSVRVTRGIMSSTAVQSDELRWLISVTYNMGVQVYNKKHYDLACEPLELAFDAAWSRVSTLCGITAEEPQSVFYAISEAYGKTTAFFDSLKRNGSHGKAKSAVLRALRCWMTVHTKYVDLGPPEPLLRLWNKLSLGQSGTMCCLYDSLSGIAEQFPAASLGLLLEEHLALLESVLPQRPADIETRKEALVTTLLEQVYHVENFPIDRSRLLLEKSRVVRRHGIENVQVAIDLLTQALEILNAASRVKCSDDYLLRLHYHQTVAYLVRAHCTQEAAPTSKDYIHDVTCALRSWDSLSIPKHCIWKYYPRRFYSEESMIQLLISTADLLSIKGNHSVQLQIHRLAQEISAHDQVSSQERLSIWANARISHVLCPVPYNESFLSMLTGSAGRRVETLDFWCKCARNFPGSLINARQNLLYADKCLFPDPLEEYVNDLDTALKTQTLMSPNGLKSAREVIVSAGQKFFLAEVLLQRGDVGAALKCATECLELRSKLVSRTFQPSGQQDGRAAKKFEASGTLATCAWPSLYATSSSNPASQWHILGDYIESLMQVGALHQTMGVPDEAEKNFQEGLRLSQEQNLPFARALFLSSLGEVHRKEHLWHIAEEELRAARDLFEDMDSNIVCSHCLVIAKANLQLRLGDLARRCPKNDPEDGPAPAGNLAIAHYDSATRVLRELPLFEEACATAEKPLVLKCSTRGKKQAEPASKNLFHEFVHIKVGNKSMSSWISSKWQTFTKRLMGKLLLQKGKCYHMLGVFNKAQQVYLRASSLLCISKCCLSPPHWNWNSSWQPTPFLLEEAAVLHRLSLLFLSQWHSCENRVPCEESTLSIAWLYRAFSSSCSAPPLFRKVSQLLAVLHAFPPFSISDFPVGRNVAELKEIGAFFHQASIGSRTRQQHLVMLQSKLDALHKDDEKVQCLKGMVQALRVLPEGSDFPVANVRTLVDELPSTTVCCISLLDEEFSFLFQEALVDEDQHLAAWMLISRFGDGDVVVSKFPIRSDSSSANRTNCDEENETRGRHKSILEGDALVRNVLAELAEILQESRQSTSSSFPISTQEEKSQWWKWRTQLDARLATFLRNVESSWFGPWRCLLLGEPLQGPVAQAFRKKAKDICKLLKSKTFLGHAKLPKPPDEALVKVLLQGVCSLEIGDVQNCVSYILGFENTDEAGPTTMLIAKAADAFVAGYAAVMSPETATRSRSSRKGTSPKPSDVVQALEREAVQLVLDGRLQGFPWESLPVMRKYEAYRMPSLGSIRALSLFHKHSSSTMCDLSEGLGRLRLSAKSTWKSDKPSVNPFNAFYLLNPSGDLETTQAAFEEWFRRQKGWEGKAGQVPTIEEYVAGLQQHDLFIYLGHGSGDQYLPEKYIRKLENCPASLLMGCSSGRFCARGDYEPVGVPLSYLMAGCPVAIANLWDVTDGDIDRFSRTVLHSWLDKKNTPTSSEEPKVNKPLKAAPRRGRSAKGTGQDAGVDSQTGSQDWEEFRIGPSVEAGRDSCKLPYLIGASPVCFGVPTIIRRSRAAVASSPSSSTKSLL